MTADHGGSSGRPYYGTPEMLAQHLRSTADHVACAPVSYRHNEGVQAAAGELRDVLDILAGWREASQ